MVLNYNIFIINDIISPSPVNISIQYSTVQSNITGFNSKEEILRNLNPFPSYSNTRYSFSLCVSSGLALTLKEYIRIFFKDIQPSDRSR